MSQAVALRPPGFAAVVTAIARREVASFFRLPVGWVAIALYLFLGGAVFVLATLQPGGPASMREFFTLSSWLLVPVAPAISMRLLSEERRTGTIEPLLTAPVSDAAVVLGKYVGGMLFLLCMLAPTLVFVAILYAVSSPSPDPGPIIAGYACLGLLGLFYLSVGVLVSSLTSNQTLAFLGTFFVLIVIQMVGAVIEYVPAWAREPLRQAEMTARVADFAKGVIDLSHVVYFMSASALFVVLTIVVMESRRWR